jgi:hypothetical protein
MNPQTISSQLDGSATADPLAPKGGGLITADGIV